MKRTCVAYVSSMLPPSESRWVCAARSVRLEKDGRDGRYIPGNIMAYIRGTRRTGPYTPCSLPCLCIIPH